MGRIDMSLRIHFTSHYLQHAASLALVLFMTAAPTSPVRGELAVIEHAGDQSGLTVFKMTVDPAAAPSPTFKYRLLPSEADLRPGNAALYYCRAFAESGVAGAWKAIEKEYGFDEVHGGAGTNGWYQAERPLADLPLDKVRDAAHRFDTYIEQCVERGSLRRDCDWGRNLEELTGLDIISLLLPEIQESRSLSRAIMLQTRVAVADRNYDRAVELLRMNYQMGVNVARDPILVSGLVGIAECNMGNHELLELIAAKDSPNMYWALAAMPRPLIDVLPAVRYELGWGMRIFPVFGDAETAEHSSDEWGRRLAKAMVDAQEAVGGPPSRLGQLEARAAITGLAIFVYPDAKRRLVAAGMDAERVEHMPVGQVIALDAAREYRRIGDEIEKTWYLSLPEMKKTPNPDRLFEGNKLEGGFGRVMAGLLMPALQAVRNAQVRLTWQLNAIQVVEALRLHAAETGKLPATLDEIKSVPIPLNVATGKPYQYRLDGKTAILDLPFSDGFTGAAWRVEITLAGRNDR
jgi:hypothetical protein